MELLSRIVLSSPLSLPRHHQDERMVSNGPGQGEGGWGGEVCGHRRDRARFLLAAALLAGLAGCNEDAFRPPPAATASSSPPAPASASGSAPAPAARSNAFFTVVARSPDAFELYPLKGALFVDAAGFLASLGDGPLRQSPATMKGLEKGVSGRLLGAYPDGAWLVSGEATYKWTGDAWAENALLRPHETLLDIAAWGDGRAVAAIGMPGNDMRFVLAGGKEGGVLPAPSPADAPVIGHEGAPQPGEGDEGDEAPCKVRMKPRGVLLAGLPGGELFAAGHACEPTGHGAAIVERWAPDQAHGTAEALPGQGPVVKGILARSPGEVIVYGGEGVPAAPYLARFDGKAWIQESAPFGGAVDTLATADDGTLWAAAGGAVWKKAGASAWEKVPLPGGLVAHAVWPRTEADVWVSAREPEGKARAVLLRSTGAAKDAELLRLPPRNAMAGMIATSKHFFATAACDKVYAHLYTIGPSKDPATGKPAEAPKDFPALKPVLEGDFAGLQPVVEDDGAHLEVGVPVPSREVGRRLVAAYQDKNPGATPALFCHEVARAPAESARGAGRAPKRR